MTSYPFDQPDLPNSNCPDCRANVQHRHKDDLTFRPEFFAAPMYDQKTHLFREASREVERAGLDDLPPSSDHVFWEAYCETRDEILARRASVEAQREALRRSVTGGTTTDEAYVAVMEEYRDALRAKFVPPRRDLGGAYPSGLPRGGLARDHPVRSESIAERRAAPAPDTSWGFWKRHEKDMQAYDGATAAWKKAILADGPSRAVLSVRLRFAAFTLIPILAFVLLCLAPGELTGAGFFAAFVLWIVALFRYADEENLRIISALDPPPPPTLDAASTTLLAEAFGEDWVAWNVSQPLDAQVNTLPVVQDGGEGGIPREQVWS